MVGLIVGLMSIVGFSGRESSAQVAPPLGAGLAGVSDWGRTHEFANIFRTARPWGSPTDPWLGQESIALDANGWPAQDAGVVIMCCQPPNQGLDGVYRISFECNTTPEIRPLINSGTIQNVSRNSATGIVTAELVVPQNPTDIMLGFFNTQGGVRNVKIMRPGTVDGQQFTQAFLEHNARFNVLRFMDWTRTNNSPIVHWWQRNRPDSGTYRDGSGVPYEVCIDLCNMLGKDMWINVPHLADEDFIRQMARLIRDRLNPELHVYVEYSNETWNFLFQQGDWLYDQAVAEAASGDSDLSYDGSLDENKLRWRLNARKTVQVSQIFEEEFGQGSINGRVRVVLAGQFLRGDMYDIMMNYIEAVHGRPVDFIYSLAGAPYFSIGNVDDQRNDLTTDEVLVSMQQSLNNFLDGSSMERMSALTTWYNLAPMSAYEGGPDTAGPNNLEAKRQAYYREEMRVMCTQYLQAWFAAGGGQFQWFVSGATSWITPFGAFSLTELMSNQNTPKIRAVDTLVSAPQPQLSIGAAVPGSIDLRRHIRRDPDWESRPMPLLGPGSYVDYLVRANETNDYSLRLNAAGFDLLSRVWVFVNGEYQGDVTIPRTGDSVNRVYRLTDPLSIRLSRGLNVIRLRPVNANYQFHMITAVVDEECDSIDFNNDGSVFDPTDIEAFLSKYSEGPCIPANASCNDIDFNNDDSIFDPADIAAFLRVYSEGPCAP